MAADSLCYSCVSRDAPKLHCFRRRAEFSAGRRPSNNANGGEENVFSSWRRCRRLGEPVRLWAWQLGLPTGMKGGGWCNLPAVRSTNSAHQSLMFHWILVWLCVCTDVDALHKCACFIRSLCSPTSLSLADLTLFQCIAFMMRSCYLCD